MHQGYCRIIAALLTKQTIDPCFAAVLPYLLSAPLPNRSLGCRVVEAQWTSPR